jgi:head-tail adaptor
VSVATLANSTITVQRPTITPDPVGGRTITWADHLTLKARVQPRGGRETINNAKIDDRTTHFIYIPGAPDVQQKDRITQSKVRTGRSLYILRVENIDLLDHHLRVQAEERDDG